MVLGDPTLADRLSPRSIEKMAAQWVWANTSKEDREKAKKDKEFEEWAKSITPGWVPTAKDLQKTRITR